MSRTLALIGAGWESARSSAVRGASGDALNRVRTLLACPDVPADIAADAHQLAGQLLLDAEKYPQARRHFRAAARLTPACAATYYKWGLAQERDPHGSDSLAARLFRRASEMEPKNAGYRAAFGRAAVRCNRTKLGVQELLAVAQEAVENLEVLRVVVGGLVEARRLEEAHRVLNQARFLMRDPANGRELTALQERLRFETARRLQQETNRNRHDADLATEGGRLILPFVRLAAGRTGTRPSSGGYTRRDVLSIPRPHRHRVPVSRADG